MLVTIDKLDHFGRGITYINGKICFIKNALPEEKVNIKIIEENKKYLLGQVEEYIEISKDRISEECPYSKICGGCQLNHMSYELENKWKEEKVKEIITKYAKINPNVIKKIKYNEREYYRNKLTVHGNKNELGYYQEKTNHIININKCLLVNNKINKILNELKESKSEIKELIIKTSNDEQELLLGVKGELKNKNNWINPMNSVYINGKCITAKETIQTKIGPKKYEERLNSFFQIHKTLTKELYDAVKEQITLQDRKIIDLYCGTGTIGLYCTNKNQELIGIDNNIDNIKDANKNKIINNLENAIFICDKVENQIKHIKTADVIIVDPPRKGLDKITKSYLKQLKVPKIIYVSCDPMTLARDINELKEEYNITSIHPFNMFPRTYHVECVSLLSRKTIEK